MEAFCTIESKTQEGNNFVYQVKLNAEHSVYKGHFPQTPVAPGVMLTDMVRLLAEEATQKELELVEARNIKFLKPVLPQEQVNFSIELNIIEEDGVKVKVVGKANDEAYFKVSALLK